METIAIVVASLAVISMFFYMNKEFGNDTKTSNIR